MSELKQPKYEEVKPSKTELNLEVWARKNRNIVIGAIAVIILIPLGWFAYERYVAEPKEIEAADALFAAEQYFALDSFNLALNGNNEVQGFISIIDNFGGTDAANLSHYYAGVCHYNLGQYNEAIEQLKDFSTDDLFLSGISIGLTGDAYSELKNYEEAVNHYEKAAKKNSNDLVSPVYLRKAAQLYEIELNNPDKAIELYQKVITEYPLSLEAEVCTKYLERAKAKKG